MAEEHVIQWEAADGRIVTEDSIDTQSQIQTYACQVSDRIKTEMLSHPVTPNPQMRDGDSQMTQETNELVGLKQQRRAVMRQRQGNHAKTRTSHEEIRKSQHSIAKSSSPGRDSLPQNATSLKK